MPFKNKRNGRDDKSEKSKRSYKPSSGSAPKSNPYKQDRTESSNNTRKKLFGEDVKKSHRPGSGRPQAWTNNAFSADNKGLGKPEKTNISPEKGRGPVQERTSKSSDRNRSRNDYSFERSGRGKGTGRWNSAERDLSKKKRIVKAKEDTGLIRLNRFIANAGICSRRKADELISAGVISVNGNAITELGFKVDPSKDSVRYNGELLKREKMVYVLLNKPKDFITTTDDPQERKTVMNLVEKASGERIYPVGRLDRNTTGLLLMTNDGDLAEKLSHPRNNITKIYLVELNKNLSQGDLNKISYGIELEDGLIKPDQVSYVAGGSKREIGIQIHSGKNRIVRRIFESLGYEVVKLDRVVYSNLTKKDLPRGHWRYLEEKEVIQLKHLIR
jgi:23S rRNA pseudouridine2605 synthase